MCLKDDVSIKSQEGDGMNYQKNVFSSAWVGISELQIVRDLVQQKAVASRHWWALVESCSKLCVLSVEFHSLLSACFNWMKHYNSFDGRVLKHQYFCKHRCSYLSETFLNFWSPSMMKYASLYLLNPVCVKYYLLFTHPWTFFSKYLHFLPVFV